MISVTFQKSGQMKAVLARRRWCPNLPGARIVLNPQRVDLAEVLRVETTRAPAVSLKFKSGHYRSDSFFDFAPQFV
jgi:hypothetical protein